MIMQKMNSRLKGEHEHGDPQMKTNDSAGETNPTHSEYRLSVSIGQVRELTSEGARNMDTWCAKGQGL